MAADNEALQRKLTALLEWFHRHPELSWQERETTAMIRQTLTEAGIEILPSGLESGLIAVIRGGKPGPVIGLRADIDALPMQEESGLPYASCHPGVMHACGHDFHAAMLLGAALMLQARRETLPGTVKLVFQPAEEIDQGAEVVLKTGLVDDCALFLAGHTYPGFPAGRIGIKEGPVMAAVDWFRVTLRGVGCHGGQPDKGADPVVAQAALVMALQSIVSRNANPFEPCVLSICRVAAGSARNIVPESAELEGTVRTLDEGLREKIRTRFAQITQGVAAACGVEAEIDWRTGSGAVVNDPGLCELARSVARSVGLIPDRQEHTMGGEDFACYLRGRPGLFVRVGTGGAHPGHHPGFTVDPAALTPAASFLAEMAAACLAQDALRTTALDV